MATDFITPAARSQAPAEMPPSPLRYLARQPILDRQGKAMGYELLYRTGPDSEFHGDPEWATRIMVDNALTFGVRRLTGGLTAWVNCTAQSIIARDVAILPANQVVLEIADQVEVSPELLASCKALKGAGYMLALDNFTYKPGAKQLVPIVDYIKIDFLHTPALERHRLLSLLRQHGKILVAEKIETQEDFTRAQAEGFALFQGYFFCRPMLVSKRKIPSNKFAHLQLLAMFEQEQHNLDALSEQIKLDPAIAYRLLRYVNSPLCPIREEALSIQRALMVVGEELFRRFAVLAIFSEVSSGAPDELLRTAFVRARFCELAAQHLKLNPREQYLIGLFSLLPAMLQAPMDEAIRELPWRVEVRMALLGELGALRVPLEWIDAHERADWETSRQIAASEGLSPSQLHDCFHRAVLWADDLLSASGLGTAG